MLAAAADRQPHTTQAGEDAFVEPVLGKAACSPVAACRLKSLSRRAGLAFMSARSVRA
jgi:hypothetical protein